MDNSTPYGESSLNSILSKTLNLFFYLLIVSFPLLFSIYKIRGQSISLPEIFFVFLVLIWFLAVLLKIKTFRWNPTYWVFILFFLSIIISAIFSENISRSIPKLFGVAYLIGLTVITHNFVTNRSQLKKFCFAWLWGTLIVVFVGVTTIIIFYMAPDSPFLELTTSIYGAVPVGNYPRVLSTLYSSSLLCNYLILSLGILFISERLGWIKKWGFYVFLFFILLTALFTISSGLGGVALIFGSWVWFVWKEKNYLVSKLFLIGGIFSAFFFFVINFIALESYKGVPFSFRLPFFEKTLYPSSRLWVWIESAKTFLENPLNGIGIGLPSCEVHFINTDGTPSLLNDAHNVYLSIASQAGLIGFIALLVLIFFLLRELFPLKEKGKELFNIRVFLAITFLSGFVYQGFFGSFEDARHIWVLFGLILSFGKTFENGLNV